MKIISVVLGLSLLLVACSHDEARKTDSGAGYTHSAKGVPDYQEEERSAGDPQ